jgi:uncharacterized protein (UPF0303 family)
MGDEPNRIAIETLIRQEQALVLTGFDEDVAYRIGLALRARCAAIAAPAVIDIRSASRRYFFAALPGSTPDNDEWARRKANVVLRCHASSMLVGFRLRAAGRSQWPDAAMTIEDFADHGGSFPVRILGVGVIAAITVSGLPSREDHDLVVSTLAAYLGAVDVPPTP